MTIQPETAVHGFVADADNISLCGQRCALDLIKLTNFLKVERHLDPARAVICTNFMLPMEQLILEGLGFTCLAARQNCDELVKAEILSMVESGVRILTLGAGDGGYVPLLTRLKAEVGLRVHLIASRHCLSSRLARSSAVDGITYLEWFKARRPAVTPERRPLFPWARVDRRSARPRCGSA